VTGPVTGPPGPVTEPEWALGYAWDIVLRGRGATPFEPGRAAR